MPSCAPISRYFSSKIYRYFSSRYPGVSHQNIPVFLIKVTCTWTVSLTWRAGDSGRDNSQDSIGSAKFQTEGGRSNLRGCHHYHSLFMERNSFPVIFRSNIDHVCILVARGQIHNLGRLLREWTPQWEWNCSGWDAQSKKKSDLGNGKTNFSGASDNWLQTPGYGTRGWLFGPKVDFF